MSEISLKKDGIVFVMDATHGTTYHRILMPAYALKQKGYNVYVVKSLIELQKDVDLNFVHTIVFSRMIAVRTNSVVPKGINAEKYKQLPTHEQFKALMKIYDINIIVDIDDKWELQYNGFMSHVSSYNQLQKFFVKDSVKIADTVWCASKELCKQTHKQLGVPKDKIVYIPNGINSDLDIWKPTPMPDKELTFGYTGASGHINDVRIIGGVFNERPIQTLGFTQEGVEDYTKVMGNGAFSVDWQPLEQYPTLYDTFHVSVSPLENTSFNNCKSNLKVVEAAFKKRAIIVSDVPLYTELIKHGVNGIICKTKADWHKEVNAMTTEKANDLAEALYDSVKDTHNINTLNTTRIKSIFSL